MDDNISLPVRYSYLCFLPDDKADIIAASLLISYYSFPSLILSLIVTILYYKIELHPREFTLYTKKVFLNFKGLFDGSVVSLAKKEYGSEVCLL